MVCTADSSPVSKGTRHWRAYVPILVTVAAAAFLLLALSPMAWVVLLNDGLLVVAVVAAACGWGAWPAAWLGHGRRAGLQQVCIAAALGLGLIAVVTLALGVMGALARVTGWILIGVGGCVGGVRLYVAQRRSGSGLHRKGFPLSAGVRKDSRTSGCTAEDTLTPVFSLEGSGSVVAATVLLLPLAVPLAIGLFGACLPPGVLWNGEAHGYDALEYHLEVPREYYDAGRIKFLPHNVFASFPQQVELLYLLLMHLAGGPLPGAIPAQLLHVALGLLAVLALAAWTPAGWPRWVVAVVAGCVPWLAYLGCLAYVENGVLFFTAVAGGLALDAVCSGRPSCQPLAAGTALTAGRSGASLGSAVFTAGLCAGLAGGCKYIALALAGAAMMVSLLCVGPGAPGLRLRRLGLFLVGVIAAFSPWLVRNAALTGNPVYPFGYHWFDGAPWSEQQNEQWERALRLPPEQDSARGRLAIVGSELFAAPLFGPTLFLLALVGAVLGRSRPVALLGLWFALMLATWAGLTHMPGRFAVPIVVPLALLIGWACVAACGAAGRRWVAGVVVCAAWGGTLASDLVIGRQLWRHNDQWTTFGAPLRLLVGATEGFAREQPLTSRVPPGSKVWLIGEARAFYLPAQVHYTVVFNRDPWLEMARTAAPAECLAWLRTQNIAYVVFSWPEIYRLQRSYGFPSWVTPQWVESLIPAGLRRVAATTAASGGDMDLYKVLPG
jgi:hypothetical protein